MLSAIGVDSVDSLFSSVPKELRAKSFNLPPGETEFEIMKTFQNLAARNSSGCISFMGGGYYDHFIPAAVDAVSSRPEFYTAYTPYQPEASQGTLRAIFEYQTMIAALTGMEYSNASLYDGGTALYEAIAMAVRTNNRTKIVIDSGVNPLFRRIVKTYIINFDIEIVEADLNDVYTDTEKIKPLIDENTSAVVVSNPNFFGYLSDYTGLFEYASKKGAASIMCFYPLSLGILKTPGEMKADIAVAEGQSLGLPLSFGGPYLGMIAVNKKHLRKMPGRIVGETADKEGKKAYVLTLQAREQHIRREKATSNICSNQALCALRAGVYLALLGRQGLKEAALINFERAEYLKAGLGKISGLEVKEGDTFNEFTVNIKKGAGDVVEKMIKNGYLGGLPVSLFYPGKEGHIIISATEKRTENEINKFIETLKKHI